METEFKIVCPYCDAPYTAEMKDGLYASEVYGCETCGTSAEVEGTFDIHCSNCKKLIYRKEY